MRDFPADAVPVLPLAAQPCPRCEADVTPADQALGVTGSGEPMHLAHYTCACGCTWGHYCPITQGGN